jgi:hypothetical protein
VRALVWIVAANVVSTALHYAHNYVEIERYPESDLVSNETVQAGILISWPLLTAVGLYGVWLYGRRRLRGAHACLLAYSVLGLFTLAHFVDGVPQIGAWFATIVTDALAALALVAFVVWSRGTRRVAA